MRIRRLKLTGFKSFVDPAELVIEPGLTGVVGPNGCGKSNLLEAIRWVMGEGSPKSLRGGGMEDVIFAGTECRPARDFAEVFMLVERDGREAEVVRRIERGAGSAYRIDGGDVRQKDVALLFADAATGAHSPALVSQGRIGAIIAARPVERRAMLEEAAGIAGLHVRRRDAEQRLRATEANLERLDTILADMETRSGALRRQARAAERYRLLSADIRLAEARLIWARWRDAAAAADAARKDAAAAAATVAEATTAQATAQQASSEAAERAATARRAAEAAREEASAAGHHFRALDVERAALDRRLVEVAALVATLERDRAREGALAEDAAQALSRLDVEVEALTGRVQEAGAARPQLVERLRVADEHSRDAEVALARGSAAEAAEQADGRIATAALVSARRRLARAEEETARVAREADALGDDAAPRRSLADAERARADAAHAASEAMATLARAEASRETADAARATTQAGVAEMRAALASLEAERDALARSLPARSATGRALDLLRVASGYERALAAALGDDLDAPVAEAGVLRWAGTSAADDPPLPPGCEPLAAQVQAPAALARRLAQVGVVERDDGVSLAAGQRLVTRDGRLRRWDGLIAEDRGAATAQGLVRRNRMAELDALLPVARAGRAQAEAAAREAAAAMAIAAESARSARSALGAADAHGRQASVAEDRARLALERLGARSEEIAARAARAREERDAAEAEAERAVAAVAALPDASATSSRVAAARTDAAAAREVAGALKLDLATLDRAVAVDRERREAALGEARSWRARAGDAARRIAEIAERAEATRREATTLAEAPAQLDAAIAEARALLDRVGEAVTHAADAEAAATARLKAAETRLAAVNEAVTMAREVRATAAARVENQEMRRVEMGRISGERFQCPAAVLPATAGFDAVTVKEVPAESARFDRLSADRERLGPVNLVAETELAALERDRTGQARERDELAQAVHQLRGSIGSLNREGRQRLVAAFEAVDGHFQRLFSRLFGGGEAHLALIDSDDPLEAGLEIMAQPPGKKLASLTLLSGGEQALTACALIFALFLTAPAPICVLDEVDAPLDDANIERFCDMLDQMTAETDTRYLVVTHNAVTMARMHRLFGVTMVERGVSRLVSVDLGGAEHLLAAE
ncbi:chromosome segregation SMC family protein [Sphingomonas sp.]|uniref:chromosome segregation SMC family protein n=1 Tax=Sphingomonas sp. TaxID=28214 RepID=UPI003B009BBC